MSTTASVHTPSLSERLVGSWTLVSYQARSDDGCRVIHPLGTDAKGYILYTADGYMSAQIMRRDRPRYRFADTSGGTDIEAADAARGYLAYSGPYHVQDDSVVVHAATVSLLPNWVDLDQPRSAVLDGNRLQLSSTAPVRYGDERLIAVLLWERATPYTSAAGPPRGHG